MQRRIQSSFILRAGLAFASALLVTSPVSAGREVPAAPAGSWTSKADLPAAFSEVSVAVVGGKLYTVGGSEYRPDEAPLIASTAVHRYDPVKDRWESRAPFPVPANHVGIAALGGKLYAVGGFNDVIHIGPQAGLFVYDPATDRWSALAPLPTARGSVAVAAVGGKLHVIGGRLSDKVVEISPPGGPTMKMGLNTVTAHDVFDPKTGTWSAGPPLPAPPRDHMGVAVLRGKIHIFGGRINDMDDLLDRHDVFDPKTGGWSSAAPLPEKRSAGASVVLKGRILYAGGECKPGGRPGTANTFDAVTAYDPVKDRWTSLKPLPNGGRHGFGAGAIGKTAYFVAGSDMCGGGATADVSALTIP